MRYLTLFILLFTIGCGDSTIDRRTEVDPNQKELNQLKAQILNLQGTIAQIQAFTANDFTDCTSNLPTFEAKVCAIAQTATSEQRLEFASQLADMSKIFQTEIYGGDCVDDIEIGCPVTGSILDRMGELDVLDADVASLQTDVLTLQLDLNAVNNRLDNFNGTGSSIETVLTAVSTEIQNLDTRVSALENTVSADTVYKTYSLCEDISNSGPLYEAVLMAGDRQSITGYIESGGSSGLAIIKTFGDGAGSLFDTTSLNTRACNFKIYEDVSDLRICWRNNKRNAAEAEIDTECDLVGGFASPTANCTCR